MATLAEIRAKLKEAEQRTSDSNKSTGDNQSYPFWNLKAGEESCIRFLPDGDTNNTFFWVERAMIKLPFAGIKGQADSKEVIVQVPCMEMYEGGVCPILSEVRAWFKDPQLETIARKYWKKRSYVFQGFVTEDGLNEKEVPENPIRRFVIGPQIFTLIKAALVDPELTDLPTDYINGLDFRLKKGTKGDYADYSTSSWSRRERPLNAIEQAAATPDKLLNLSTFLPKQPSAVELKVITEMFEASVDGEAYDADRWSQYYKPYGLTTTAKAAAPADEIEFVKPTPAAEVPWVEPTVAVAAPPVVETAAPASDNRAADILAMIRNRQTQ